MTINFSSIKPYIYKWISVMGETVAITLSNLTIAFILTSKFGLEYYGEFALYQTLFLVYSVALKPLTWQSIVKFCPKVNLKLLCLFSLYTEIRFLMISAVVMTIILLSFEIRHSPQLMYFYAVAYIVINNGTIIGLNRSVGNFYNISILVFVSSVFKVLITLFYTADSLTIFSALIFCDFIFWLIFSFWYLVKFKVTLDLSNSDVSISEFNRFAIWGMLHEVLDSPIKHIDKLVVSLFLGNISTGILDLAKRISQIVAQIAVPLNAIIFPQYSALVNCRNTEIIKIISLKFSRYLLVISVFVFCGFLLFFEYFDRILTSGLLAEQKGLVLSFLFVQLIALVFCWVHPLSIAVGNMQYIAIVILIANVIYILMIVFLSKFIGLYSVALAFLVQVTVVILAKLIIIKRFIESNP